MEKALEKENQVYYIEKSLRVNSLMVRESTTSLYFIEHI